MREARVAPSLSTVVLLYFNRRTRSVYARGGSLLAFCSLGPRAFRETSPFISIPVPYLQSWRVINAAVLPTI